MNSLLKASRYGKQAPPIPDFNKLADVTDISQLQSEALKWKTLNESWEKSLQEKELSFAESLRPGAWNSVDIALPNTKPEEIRHLELRIRPDRVFLQQP